MPHDKNGVKLEPGDRVTMEFIVQSVSMGETGCNVNINAVSPPDDYRPNITCNSRSVEKITPATTIGWTPPMGIGSAGLILLACCLLAGCSHADARTPAATAVVEIAFASLAATPSTPAPSPSPGVCPQCNGSGKVGDGRISVTCGACNGSGRITAYESPTLACECDSCQCRPCRCDGREAYREAVASGEPLLVAAGLTAAERHYARKTADREGRRFVEVQPFKGLIRGVHRFTGTAPLYGPGQPQTRAPRADGGDGTDFILASYSKPGWTCDASGCRPASAPAVRSAAARRTFRIFHRTGRGLFRGWRI